MQKRINILTTKRCNISLLNDGDYQDLLAMRTDPRVMRFVGDGDVQTSEQVRQHVELARSYYDDYGLGFFCVRRLSDDAFLGQAGLFHLGFDVHESRHELAYRFACRHWGQGYATECAVALIDWGFGQFDWLEIIAMVDANNVASQRVMQKAGMVSQGCMRYRDRLVPYYRIERE